MRKTGSITVFLTLLLACFFSAVFAFLEAARVSGNTVTAGNRTYLMSDNVLVYEYRGGDYYLSSLDRVKDGGYELSAWYDRSEKDGGRIRVIVAK